MKTIYYVLKLLIKDMSKVIPSIQDVMNEHINTPINYQLSKVLCSSG